MLRQLTSFIIRWILNSCGIWIAVRFFGTGYTHYPFFHQVGTFLVAGLIFSLINSILRPIIIILALPAILLTLGLFTLIINGLMVYLSLKLAPGFSMSFGYSILTGMLLSLINYIVSSAFQYEYARHTEEKE